MTDIAYISEGSMNKTKRLLILEASLEKKKDLFDSKLDDHFATVRQANGQPMNDKMNGAATMRKWDKQSDSLRALQESIEKTEAAIEREIGKIADVEAAKNILPKEIIDMIDAGKLNQWRKYPNTFFVPGVDKARIVWDTKNKVLCHRYVSSITDRDQYKIFAKTFNTLSKEIAKGE